MPRLVRRVAAAPERRGRVRRGHDVDLRWDPASGTVELAIVLSDGEAVLPLRRETLRHLVALAMEAQRALDDDPPEAAGRGPAAPGVGRPGAS